MHDRDDPCLPSSAAFFQPLAAAGGPLTWATLCFMAFLPACASYGSAELNGPASDMSGHWVWDKGGGTGFTLQQNSERRDSYVMTSTDQSAHPRVSTWSATGRVLRETSGVHPDGWYVMTPDGARLTGELHKGYELTHRRVIVRPAADEPALAANPWLAGGVVVRLCDDGPLLSDRHFHWAAPFSIAGHVVVMYYDKDWDLAQEQSVVSRQFHVSPIGASAMMLSSTPQRSRSGPFFHLARHVEARRASASLCKREFLHEGRPCWVIGRTLRHDAGFWRDFPDGVLIAEIYDKDPDSGAPPVEILPVARVLPGGEWVTTAGRPVKSMGQGLLGVRAVNANDSAAPYAELFEADERAIMSMKPVQGIDSAELRWWNRALLMEKVKWLPEQLRASKDTELRDRVVRLEQRLLDCARAASLARDKATDAVSKGGSDEEARALSLAYDEQVVILKAMLAAVKDELGARQR